MNCPKCSYKLTLLFTGTACDKCDGLLKQETTQDVGGRDGVWACLFADDFGFVKRHRMTCWFPRSFAQKHEDVENAGPFDQSLVFIKLSGGEAKEWLGMIWDESQRVSPKDRLVLDYFIEEHS